MRKISGLSFGNSYRLSTLTRKQKGRTVTYHYLKTVLWAVAFAFAAIAFSVATLFVAIFLGPSRANCLMKDTVRQLNDDLNS